MRKKIMMAILSGTLFVNSVAPANPVYAANSSNIAVTAGLQDRITERIVYVEDGEGTEGVGKGTKDSPFQNIRTALDHIQDGEVLKLVGMVRYTKYEKHTDGSAKPLFFNKQITVEGNDETSGLMVRTTIQLGADVTFRNMNLQMIPETILGRMLGQQAERSTTIFAAGHSVTLDHVNTKLSSPGQEAIRPYISGGAYKGLGTVGEKAVIRVINPSSETKLAGIYAGDYWNDREMDVEVHIDGGLVEPVLYAGGVNGILHGNVEITLYGKSNLSRVDRSNHRGNVNVRVAENAFIDTFSLDNINEVVVENKARMKVPASGRFNVEKVTLKNEAVIDFRYMKESPVIAGDFIGTVPVENVQKSGAVLLNNEQTLQIAGSVSGLTRLNTNGVESMSRFVDGHVYISANKKSEGDFTIEGTDYTEFEIRKNTEQEKDVWVVCKKEPAYSDKFSHFIWQGGEDKIINPQFGDEFVYPILFYNNNDTEYRPGPFELLQEFEYDLVRKDGAELDLDWDVFLDWDFEQEEENDPDQLKLIIYNPEKTYGELLLTVTHIESGKQIQREIHVLSKEEMPSVKPTETPSAKPTEAPSEKPTEEPSVKPTETPSAKPTQTPSEKPAETPSVKPTEAPSEKPAETPSIRPTETPSAKPTETPSAKPTETPSAKPTETPSAKPTETPSAKPTETPSAKPTEEPSAKPTEAPSEKPTQTPTVKPASIKLNQTKATIYTDGSTVLQLKASVVGTSTSIRYTSSNSKIARVDKNGRVTAVAAGTAVIAAEANGIKASCTVTVKRTSLKLNVTRATIYTAGETAIRVKPTIVGSNQEVTYTSSNKKVAKVDKNGKVTAVKAGTAVITVQANGLSQKCKITVKKPELRVSKTTLTVKPGKKATISAKATPKGTITFDSGNKKVATVNKQGVVTGVKAGTATITVKCNGVTKKVTVKVKK